MITRGIWFYDGSWQPIDSEYSNSLEDAHLEIFYGKKLSDYVLDPSNKTPKAGNKQQTVFLPYNHLNCQKKFVLEVDAKKNYKLRL